MERSVRFGDGVSSVPVSRGWPSDGIVLMFFVGRKWAVIMGASNRIKNCVWKRNGTVLWESRPHET